MASLDQLTSGVGRTIGGYFNVVSVVPSAVLVIWLFLLVRSGAPREPPDWSQAFAAVTSAGAGDVASIVAAAVVLGLLLHPLQFAIVQMYEGYWGLGRTAVALRSLRTQRYLARKDTYERLYDAMANDHALSEQTAAADTVVRGDEAARLLDYLPRRPRDVMPTRLGNVLRHYETAAGASYGLTGPRVLPHLALVAPAPHMAYLNDQRTLLDLAVRLSFLSLVGAVAAVALLWPFGLWSLVALLPYSAGYLFYRGAVVVAGSYGLAMAAIVDLNRFVLYESLHLGPPTSTRDERERNTRLNALLNFDPSVDLRYPVVRAADAPLRRR